MIQIFYFSGSGNTELLASKLLDQLKADGNTVSIHAIKKSTEPSAGVPERLVLFFPVYAFDAPVVHRTSAPGFPIY
jgi:flavodoxin